MSEQYRYGEPGASAARHFSFSATEWLRLGGFYGAILLMHLLGFGLFLYYSVRYPALFGLGFAAYMFGLRHAFDADHIAAVDDTVRYLLQKGQKPLGIGFFFSLGHSTVVFILALVIAFAANTAKQALPELQHFGGLIGTSVSGLFLWLIGILNFLLLLDILKVWRLAKTGQHSHAHLDALLAKRGLLNRLFGGRLQRFIQSSWQMYPLGLLFGLGFDTASEIALLAMTAGAASGNLPIGAVLSLPVLFAAGMSLMDTTDGVLMVKAYHWAFVNPLRKIFYNLTTTSLSIAVALVIGSIELLQVFIHLLRLQGPFYDYVSHLNFGVLGYVIVGIFLLVWGGSTLFWKVNRFDEMGVGETEIIPH
ncbi:MAG: HoxN/HupN/NixA family nickel/cobalt transporter [Betaproteobacteria bacterium]|nr:HoxN/HupN/NixA family nickel/cobalt transporter [Betaproteobacteria bacterium]